MSRRSSTQPDLFGAPQGDLFEADGGTAAPAMPEVDEAFMEAIRRDLHALLDKARKAERLPWKDFTASALAEMRFEGLLRWLPEDEAKPLAEEFAAHLDRLYEAG